MNKTNPPSRSFWRRPEGITGAIILIAGLVGGGYLLYLALPFLISMAENTLLLAGMMLVLGAVIYMAFDPKMRTLISYMYQSVMRWITGWIIDIDPIGVLKNYTEELEKNIVRMRRQINRLRGQTHSLKEHIVNNSRDIEQNLSEAQKAKEQKDRSELILKSRKAGRLKDSNIRLEELHERMEKLYRLLQRMHEHSKVMLEDVRDQVRVKEQERETMRASHSAIESAMNIVSGDRDKRQNFNRALEATAEDVGEKVGEMERFMKVSEQFMESVDLQKGVFREKGLEMLEEWERESDSTLLGKEKEDMLSDTPEKAQNSSSSKEEKKSRYGDIFE